MEENRIKITAVLSDKRVNINVRGQMFFTLTAV